MKPKKKKSKTESLEARRRADALALARLIYDIYQDKKSLTPDSRDKKE